MLRMVLTFAVKAKDATRSVRSASLITQSHCLLCGLVHCRMPVLWCRHVTLRVTGRNVSSVCFLTLPLVVISIVIIIIVIIHAFITCTHSVMILNQRCWQSLHKGSSIKDVRRKGGRGIKLNADKSGQGGGGFQHKRTSTYLSHVVLEDRAVCVSACKPEP